MSVNQFVLSSLPMPLCRYVLAIILTLTGHCPLRTLAAQARRYYFTLPNLRPYSQYILEITLTTYVREVILANSNFICSKLHYLPDGFKVRQMKICFAIFEHWL